MSVWSWLCAGVAGAAPPADASFTLGPFTVTPPPGAAVSRSQEVGAHVVPDGFTQRTYAGDAWITPAGADPHRTLILARLDLDPQGTVCTGALGAALALGGTVDEEIQLRLPAPGCTYTLRLPGDRVEFVRARQHPAGRLELLCFGPAAEADALRSACDGVFQGLRVAPGR